MPAEHGIKYAVTGGAKQRLLGLLEDQESTAPQREGKAAAIEVSRLTKEELGSRLVPLAGAYLQADAQVRLRLPECCAPCHASFAALHWRCSAPKHGLVASFSHRGGEQFAPRCIMDSRRLQARAHGCRRQCLKFVCAVTGCVERATSRRQRRILCGHPAGRRL